MRGVPEDRDRFISFYDRVRNYRDGSSEGGLIFIIAFFSGLILVERLFPRSLETLLVWFIVMSAAVWIAVWASRIFAALYGNED